MEKDLREKLLNLRDGNIVNGYNYEVRIIHNYYILFEFPEDGGDYNFINAYSLFQINKLISDINNLT